MATASNEANVIEMAIRALDDTQIKIDVPWSMDNIEDGTFDSLPDCNFSAEDHAMMAEILGLKKKKKNIYKNIMETSIMPSLPRMASENDCVRSITQHKLKQELYLLKVEQEFHCDKQKDFRKNEIKKENKYDEDFIDASEFDEDDFGVLELINTIISSTDRSRDKSQKKSTNHVVREAREAS